MKIGNYDGSVGDDLYDRLDRNKSPDTSIVNNREGFASMIGVLSKEQNSGKGISLGIGGGGAFGQASFLLAKAMLDKGIKPKEYVGNSVGAITAMLLSQGYTDEKYIDFFFEGADKGGLSSSFRLSKFLPFTITLDGLTRELIIKRSLDLCDYLKKNSVEVAHAMASLKSHPENIRKVIDGFLQSIGEKSLSAEEGLPLSFNDILEKHDNKLSIQAGVLAMKSKFSSFMNPGSGGTNKGNKSHSHGIRSISFRGFRPVLEALMASTSTDPRINTPVHIQGKKFRMGDGYFAGQQFPHKDTDFAVPVGEPTVKVVLQTDDNWSVTQMTVPNYGENTKYVIRPDLYIGGALNFSEENRNIFRQRAWDIIGS